MELKSIMEITVVLERFFNIDLCKQGLYQLELSCFYIKNSKPIKAQPIAFDSYPSTKSRQSIHNVIEGSIDEDNLSMRSRVFFIRYADEKVKINESLTFYLEKEFDNTFSQSPLYIKAELRHVKISKKRLLEDYRSVSYENSLEPVSSKTFKISSPLKGTFEYLPLVFDSDWFCAVDSLVLISFYDYKIPSSDISLFATILFSDKKGKCKDFIGGEEIDRKYSEHVSILAEVHETLRTSVKKLSATCFIEDVEIPKGLSLPVTFPNPNPSRSFADHLASHEPQQTAKEILQEIKSIAASIYEAHNLLKTLIATRPRKIVKVLRKLYTEKLARKYSEFVIKEINKRWDFDICSLENTKTQHKDFVEKMRKNEYYKNLEPLPVHEEQLFAKISSQPIVFEEIYYSETLEKTNADSTAVLSQPGQLKTDNHLFVLVHGFQGSSFDMRTLHNYILEAYPNSFFLESAYNESKTDGDIRAMGSRLSKELISFLTDNFPDSPPTISFIGHSLGGIIIRAALPFLESLADKMHMFMSLSSPHLGFMYSSKLLDAGMWVLKKVKNIKCLDQLCLEDFHKVEGTFMYLLSKADGLQWFQYVVLVSSSQDEYAPFDSARIEVPEKATKDPSMGNYYIQMAHNLLQKLTMQNLIKLDVHFKLKKSVDTVIGRSAHMQLLENKHFLKMLVYRYPEFFA